MVVSRWVRTTVAPLILLAARAALAADANQTIGAPRWPAPAQPPAAAPSVLLIMTDDVGFGASSTYGGPVPTPTFDRLAARGARYTRFHTVGICSPTRAALLTGRNHTAVGMGNVADAATGFEGYTSVIPASAGTVARVLRDSGYSTAMFGKAHIVPMWETGPAGPFVRWPTGLGFQHFYGFLGGDTNQFAPALYEDTRPIVAARGNDYIFDRDLADQAIHWMQQQRAVRPAAPVFAYFAPGTAHAPHHAPREWLDKFRGRFDRGWDTVRRETLQKQIALGLVPANTLLAARPPSISAWSALNAQQRKVYAREMEAYAAALAYADQQIGRVIDAARALLGDNLLIIYIQGDNGASAEGGPNGTLNEHAALNGIEMSVDDIERRLDTIGGPLAYGHFSNGWAFAMNTPFPWFKQLASHLGAMRNGLVIDWPGHIAAAATPRRQFAHVIDIMPTILDAAGIAAPQSLDGVAQQAIDGRSLRASLADPNAPATRTTQFFAIWDNVAIYQNGWLASTLPEVMPWNILTTAATHIDGRRWQLYDLERDFSQSTDLADREPAKLATLQQVFWDEAQRAHALPIHRSEGREGMPNAYRGRQMLSFSGPLSRVPEEAAPRLLGRHFIARATVNLTTTRANGVLMAQGGRFGGQSWYLRDGRPCFHYNYGDLQRTTIVASQDLTAGRHRLELEFEPQGGPGSAARVALRIDGRDIGGGAIPKTLLARFSLDETFDLGRDDGTPVSSDYLSPNALSGDLENIEIEFLPQSPG